MLKKVNNFINYAHRGASEYAPENTLCSFYLGLVQGANGIETDVHMTKDNVLVLFHDDTIDRVTNGKGSISDYTYKELQNFDVISKDKKLTDKIPTFEDFLKHFSFRNLTFAVELKQSNIEKETIDMLEKYNMLKKTILTSFDYSNLKRAYEVNKNYRLGYLVDEVNDEIIDKMKEINGYEICPKAQNFDKNTVTYIYKKGLSVRAWGIYNTDIMKKAYNCGVNGMTVNFPDKLTGFLSENI